MLSKNKQKHILLLSKKKNRDKFGVFVAEGHKLVCDILKSDLIPETIIATNNWLTNNKETIHSPTEIIECTEQEVKKVSALKSPPEVIVVFKQKTEQLLVKSLSEQLCLFLDEVQDPGNLGTIVRIADWFGIKNIICSQNCADIYNPKTIQSTMGAISRVNVFYVDSEVFFNEYKSLQLPIFGTFLDGQNMYKEELNSSGLIVMGNEGKGISKDVEAHVSKRLFIPSYPADTPTSESLNVSVATSIICAEFRRRS